MNLCPLIICLFGVDSVFALTNILSTRNGQAHRVLSVLSAESSRVERVVPLAPSRCFGPAIQKPLFLKVFDARIYCALTEMWVSSSVLPLVIS